MSRSRRKNSITGITTAESEKQDKQIWHKILRRKARQQLKLGEEDIVSVRDVSDPWKMDKDGKTHHKNWDAVWRK